MYSGKHDSIFFGNLIGEQWCNSEFILKSTPWAGHTKLATIARLYYLPFSAFAYVFAGEEARLDWHADLIFILQKITEEY